MTEEELKKARLTFLEDTSQFYSEDPVGRRSVDCHGKSKYRDSNGNRCAIGRYIPDEDYSYFLEGMSIESKDNRGDYLIKLPSSLEKLGREFLGQVQSLHDTNYNWDEKGLSSVGKSTFDYIKQYFRLV
jgi:hypothetical protein